MAASLNCCLAFLRPSSKWGTMFVRKKPLNCQWGRSFVFLDTWKEQRGRYLREKKRQRRIRILYSVSIMQREGMQRYRSFYNSAACFVEHLTQQFREMPLRAYESQTFGQHGGHSEHICFKQRSASSTCRPRKIILELEAVR